MLDIRPDDQLYEQNLEELNIDKLIDSISFSPVESVTTEKYNGKVYDLKIKNHKNYQIGMGLVHNGGKRKGAAAVYLDTWHPDIMEFLELRDNTGDREKRAYNLNLANWIPDLFMKRVESEGIWSLFDPGEHPELVDTFGEEFEKIYTKLEAEGKFTSQISARKIYAKMMKTLAETGNGWITFKDTSNIRCNSAVDGHVVVSSNLCTEIIEPAFTGKTQFIKAKDYHGDIVNHSRVVNFNHEQQELEIMLDGEVAVCNLGSINLSRYVTKDGKVDLAKIKRNVPIAVKFLDKVIDRNYYPIPEARNSNKTWRPVGLGIMGWQDLLFRLRVPFESDQAKTLAANIQEEIYYWALKTSMELAKINGAHDNFKKTHAAQGKLQFDFVDQVSLHQPDRWTELKADIKKHGLRNSLLIAIAPTATIGQICGSTECIEPQVSNIFKREIITTNQYLVEDLKKLDLWNQNMLDKIKMAEGSIQNITEIPEEIRALYKTAWEIKQKALIDQAVARGAFIDQSQSLNLFMSQPSLETMSSMYFYAWKNGIKTTYYLRSKPASRIQKIMENVSQSVEKADLENPEICESCT